MCCSLSETTKGLFSPPIQLTTLRKQKGCPYLTPCQSPGPIIQTSKPLFVASLRTILKWSLLFRIISSICCASTPVCSGAWQRDGRQGRLETLPSRWLVARPPPPPPLPRAWSPWHPHASVTVFTYLGGKKEAQVCFICMKYSSFCFQEICAVQSYL